MAAIQGVGPATVPGMEFAPGGPSGLQQQAFGLAGQLPGQMQFDPSQITSAMKPVGDYAMNLFQNRIAPDIMSSLGGAGVARASGAATELGRAGESLASGISAQFAPMQFGAQQAALGRQFQLPSLIGGLGGQQYGIGEAQRQFGLDRFMAKAPEADPRLGFIGPAFTSAYDTAVQQGFYKPGLGTQILGAFGGFSDKRIKENIKPIDNALEKVKKLTGYSYNYIGNDPKNRNGGIMAQDLEEVLPDAVSEINGIKYVRYDAVLALLINAIKELQERAA